MMLMNNLTFQDTMHILMEINTFICEMDEKILQMQSSYQTAKNAMAQEQSRTLSQLTSTCESVIAGLRKRSNMFRARG